MIKNIVFSGGGMKGLSYVGVLEEMHKQRKLSNLKSVTGVSVGAIIGALYAIALSDDLQNTIGFRLSSDSEHAGSGNNIDDIGDYAQGVGQLIGRSLLHRDDLTTAQKLATVDIETEWSSLDFDIPDREKRKLIKVGRSVVNDVSLECPNMNIDISNLTNNDMRN